MTLQQQEITGHKSISVADWNFTPSEKEIWSSSQQITKITIVGVFFVHPCNSTSSAGHGNKLFFLEFP
jgi:hypothetical protein